MKASGLTIAATFAVLASATGAPASAGLIGSTVTSQYYRAGGYDIGGGTHAYVVNGTATAPYKDYFTVKVTDSQIIYDYSPWDPTFPTSWTSSATSLDRDGLFIQSGSLLSFAGAPTILGVTVDAATNMAGFGASNVTFNGAEVAVNWSGLAFTNATRVVLNVQTPGGAGAVPEPSACAMLAIGLAGAAGLARAGRRRRAA